VAALVVVILVAVEMAVLVVVVVQVEERVEMVAQVHQVKDMLVVLPPTYTEVVVEEVLVRLVLLALAIKTVVLELPLQ
jgi:hypothetical protein